MLFPLSDENPTYTRPWVTYGLIAANTAVFLLVLGGGNQEEVWREYGMKPARLGEQPFTLVTSMFLHGGFFHLLGNMWFLWIVGDNVEDSLGHGWYLAAYLAGGVVADLIHASTSFGQGRLVPTIGASGAVSAVMGYYMVVFPRNRIRIFYWLWWFFMGTFYARAVWVIGAWFVLQLFWALVSSGMGGATGVAYWAHVGGFAFGAGVALALRAVWPGIDPHLRHAPGRARGAGRPGRAGRVVPEGPGMPDLRAVHPRARVDLGLPWRRVEMPAGAPVPVVVHPPAEQLERALAGRLSADDVPGAEGAFRAYLEAYPDRPMDPRLELQLVQALERRGRHAAAADCLEHFLATHPRDVNAPEAKLALGMIYSRYLGRLDRARLLLGAAAVQHPVPARAALARQELADLG